MSLPPISFFTPIKYGYHPTSLRQKMTEIVDSYFHLGGPVAVVVSDLKNGGKGVKLQAGQTIWWHSTLKVTSYVACFLNLLVTAQFPGIIASRRVVQFQLILSCFPVFMLIAKIALRATSHFDRLQPTDKIMQILGVMSSPSFFNRLKTVYLINKANHLNNAQRIWLLSVLDVFLDAYIEERCDPRVTWKDSTDYCYDSLQVDLADGTTIYRYDCLSDRQLHVNALLFKRKLNELRNEEKTQLTMSCFDGNDRGLELNVYDCLTALREITFAIQDRYGSLVSAPSSPSIKDLIHEKLKLLFKANLNQIDSELAILQEAEFAKTICKKLIIDLLSNVTISENKLLVTSHIRLDFSLISDSTCLEPSKIKHISFYQVNDLNSKNILDDPHITDQPLTLAQFLKDHPLDDIEKCPEFETFRKWIEKNYYDPFCSQLMIQLQPKQEVIQPKRTAEPRTPVSVMPNGRFTYMRYIEEQFEVKDSWSLSGSCFLSALYPQYENNLPEGRKKVTEIRALISVRVIENYQEYLDYVTIIPDFSTTDQVTKEQLEAIHWAIAQDDSKESKKEAVLTRARKILESETYLMEPEYELMAQIVNCPIRIYKIKTEKFLLDTNSHILPHVIYGERCSGAPRYLLDDSDHYKPLIPKAK